jgi:hypothetical protein
MLATSLITLVVAGFVAAAPILEDRDLPNPSQVFINNITYGGSGCPQNSVGQFLSEDRSTYFTPFIFLSSQAPCATVEGRPTIAHTLNFSIPLISLT